MKVHEIMTAHVRCVGPDNTLVEAAGLMRELDVGSLPVCEDDNLTGIVTDRDITLRGVADGRDPNTTAVRDVMTPGAVHAFAEQEVEELTRLMEERQIRRVPVLNREKRLVGIVSLGDIAISSNPAFSGMALRDVSEPRNPTARQRRLAQRSEPPARRLSSGTVSVAADSRDSSSRNGTKRSAASKTKSKTSSGAAARRKSTARASTKKPAKSKSKTTKTRSKTRRSTARAAR